MSIQIVCEFCRSKFSLAYPSLATRRRFCSRSCRSSAGWNLVRDKMKEALRVQQARDFSRTEITCSQCGKQFWIRPSRLKTAKFCSYRCSGLAHGGKNPKGHSSTTTDGECLEDHIRLAQNLLGRHLMRGENVHHINGNPRDNRPANLIVLKHGQHTTIHNLQRHRGCQLSAKDILTKFPQALWLGDILPS
ncbi:MAG TPA: hypothetical protein DCP69_02230 [Candidatus Omnitrophica bacterium]|nr:hypothetical protein [Candidatus Omnitrophota bacterium]